MTQGFLLAVGLALAVLSGFGQSTVNVRSGLADGRTPLAISPGSPEGSYSLNSFESINLYSGKVSVAVPLLTIGGRGASGYTIKAAVENVSWQVQVDASIGPTSSDSSVLEYSYGSGAVWTDGGTLYRAWYGPGMLLAKYGGIQPKTCVDGSVIMGETFSHLVFLDPDGTEHALLPKNGVGSSVNNCNSSGLNRGSEFIAHDETGMSFVKANGVIADKLAAGDFTSPYNPLDATGTLFFADGTRYLIVGGLVQQIIDRNGNMTSFGYGTRSGGGPNLGTVFVSSITDAAGRQYFIDYLVTTETGCSLPTVECDRISYKGEDGGNRKIIVVRKQLASQLRSDHNLVGRRFPELSGQEQPIATRMVLAEIRYENNTNWQFFYSGHAEIAKVVLPTGGAVEYDHGAGLTNAGQLSGVYSSGQILDDVTPMQGTLGASNAAHDVPRPWWRPVIYRRVHERREYNNIVSGETNAKRTGNAFKTSIYPRFETAAAPTVFSPQISRIADVQITSTGVIQVNHTGSDVGNSIVETHRFHDFANGTLEPASPARQIFFGAQINESWMETYPDPFQGKEYSTGIGGLRQVERVYGMEDNGRTSRVCQENVTVSDGTAITSSTVFYYDRDDARARLATAYQLGNETHRYEYQFGDAPAITLSTDPGTTVQRRVCPATPPEGYFRLTRTDYKNESAYLSASTQLHHLPVKVRVYEGSGAANQADVQLTQTDYQYDVGTAENVTNVAQAAFCNGTGKTERGNITKVSQTVRDLPGGQNQSIISEDLTYDCMGNVRTYKDPRGNTTTYAYTDSFVATPTELTGQSSRAFASIITLANGFATTRKYDFYSGRVREEVGPNGLASTFRHGDPLNRPKESVRGQPLTGGTQGTGLQSKISFQYSDTPQPSSPVTAVEVFRDQFAPGDQRFREKIGFDAFGRRISVKSTTGEAIETSTVYDGMGRVKVECNPRINGSIKETDGCRVYGYDALGRVTTVTNPDGATVVSVYGTDASTNATTVAVTDEAGKKRVTHTDAYGRIIRVVEAPGETGFDYVTAYEYDELDNLIEVTQGSQVRTFEYDSLRRLRFATNPEYWETGQGPGGKMEYQYDANGNLAMRKDPRGVITCFGSLSGATCDKAGYDSLNRVTLVTYSDGTPTVRHCYDGKTYGAGGCAGAEIVNQRLRKTGSGNSVSSTKYEYDLAGRMTKTTQTTTGGAAGGYVFDYAHYNDDRLASVRYPSQVLTVVTCYDQNGRVSWVSKERTVSDCTTGGGAAKSAYAKSFSYTPPGGIESMTLGNGVVESAGYNNRLQMKSRGAALGGVALLSLALYFCPSQASACTSNNGNLRSQVISHPALTDESALNTIQEYGYDAVNRIGEMTEGAVRETYGYDRFGNRWVTRAGLPPSALTPATQQAYHPSTNQTTAGSYDKAGNLTGYSPFVLAYDAEGRLKSAAGGPFGNGVYEYDGEGRRVRKVVGTAATIFVYDGAGNLAAEYGAGEGEPCETCYLTADHLGSTRLMTDEDGKVVRRYDYLPFGQGLTPGLNGRSGKYAVGAFPGPSDQHTVKFTGKERDAETGLDYFGARYFAGDLGRFISPDRPFADQTPLDPQGWNLYSYTRNNPLKYVDRTGEAIETAWDALNVGIGAVSFVSNVRQGNYFSAAVDAVGVVIDAAATVAPFVPGGAGTLIKAGRLAGKADDVLDAAQGLNRLDGAADAAGTAKRGPSFLVSEGGDVIPVPSGASGPSPVVNPQGKTTGFAFTGGKGGQGLHPNVSDVRVMDPTSKQPNGYVVYQNAAKPTPQGVNPQTGRTVPHTDPSRHIPLSPKRQPGCSAGGSDCQP